MMTIEGTAIPDTAVTPQDEAPRAPPPRPGDGTVPPVRLALLNAVRIESATLDRTWWPRSRSLADELPALIVDLHHREVRVTRVAYKPESWEAAPRRLPADGRVVRLGWFQGLDPHLVRLTGGDDGHARLDLLVIPTSTSQAIEPRHGSGFSPREPRLGNGGPGGDRCPTGRRPPDNWLMRHPTSADRRSMLDT